MWLAGEWSRDAVNAIAGFIDEQGGRPSSWYVGIAADWPEILFADHGVPRKGYIVRKCFSVEEARAAKSALHALGCDGAGGGGTGATVYVYAYLKIPGVTNP